MTPVEHLAELRARLVHLVRRDARGQVSAADFHAEVLVILVGLITVLDRLVD